MSRVTTEGWGSANKSEGERPKEDTVYNEAMVQDGQLTAIGYVVRALEAFVGLAFYDEDWLEECLSHPKIEEVLSQAESALAKLEQNGRSKP